MKGTGKFMKKITDEDLDDFFSEFFQIKKTELSNIKRGQNFEWDSMRHVELIIALQKKFDLKLDTKQISNIENYQDIINVIAKK